MRVIVLNASVGGGQETAMATAIIGATGNTGRAVVKELRALGQNPVCVVRSADKAREVLGGGAKTAVAELTDRPALEKALAGVQSVFVVTGHNPSMVEHQNNVLDAALKAGAQYLVRVGGSRPLAKADSESVVGHGHPAIEERLKASGIKWVILSPGMFMQNVLGQAASIKTDSRMVLPFAKDLPVALIDVRDTGAVGARILIDRRRMRARPTSSPANSRPSAPSPRCSRRCSAGQSLMWASRPSRPSRG
jgi:uncharacterized protein YbjT (DUF2867 family)